MKTVSALFYIVLIAALVVLVSCQIYLTRRDGQFVDGVPTYKYKTSSVGGYATFYNGKYVRNYGRNSVSINVPSRFKEPVLNGLWIVLIIISYVALYHGAKLAIETDNYNNRG